MMQHCLPLLHPAPLMPWPPFRQQNCAHWCFSGKRMGDNRWMLGSFSFFFFYAVDSTCSHNCMEFLVLGWAKHCWRSSEHELKLPSPFMERGFQGEKTPKLKISQGQYMMMFLIFSYMKAYCIFWKSPCRDQPPHCWQQFSHTKNC